MGTDTFINQEEKDKAIVEAKKALQEAKDELARVEVAEVAEVEE